MSVDYSFLLREITKLSENGGHDPSATLGSDVARTLQHQLDRLSLELQTQGRIVNRIMFSVTFILELYQMLSFF